MGMNANYTYLWWYMGFGAYIVYVCVFICWDQLRVNEQEEQERSNVVQEGANKFVQVLWNLTDMQEFIYDLLVRLHYMWVHETL